MAIDEVSPNLSPGPRARTPNGSITARQAVPPRIRLDPVLATPSLTGRCSAVADQTTRIRFCGDFRALSDGLEPSTPSLPSWARGGKRGQARVIATAKAPQTTRIRRRRLTRACTRVDPRVFAPRSHALSAVMATLYGRRSLSPTRALNTLARSAVETLALQGVDLADTARWGITPILADCSGCPAGVDPWIYTTWGRDPLARPSRIPIVAEPSP